MSLYFRRMQLSQVLAVTGLVAFMAFSPTLASAQSGSRQAMPSSQPTGSSTKVASPALEGYCPVCVFDMKKWVRGTAQFQSTFDGQAYLFPGQEQKETFDANPSKYVPVLAGDCVVALKKMNKRVPGNIRHTTFSGGRLFLFSNEMAQKEFLADPGTYTDVDIALGGKCTVCKVEMQQDVDGNPEIAVLYQGMRYFFPANEQREMFIANPGKYAISAASGQNTSSAVTGSQTQNGSGAKTTGQGSSRK